MSRAQSGKITLVHLLQQVSETSIPLELARNMDKDKFRIIVVSFFDSDDRVRALAPCHDLEVIGLGGRVRGFLDPCVVVRLYRVLARLKPDILHTHHNLSGSIGRLIGASLKIALMVHTTHNEQRVYRWPGLLLNTMTLRWADVIVCNSRNTQRSFYGWQRRLIRRIPQVVIYNGIDISRIDAAIADRTRSRHELGFSPEHFLIIHVARCVWQKDQATLLRAMSAVLTHIPHARMVVVGDGVLSGELMRLAKELGIWHQVVFTGLLARDRVYRLLYAADAFAMVSLYEGFCNAVVEALVARLPVIFTGISALPEVVGDAGIEVSPCDPSSIARAMIELARNPDRRKSLGLAGRKRAEENFSLTHSVNNYESLYFRFLEEKKGLS